MHSIQHSINTCQSIFPNLGLGDAKHAPAAFGKERIFPFIASLHLGPTVPVGSVAFDHQHGVREREIRFESTDFGLSIKGQPHIGEQFSHAMFKGTDRGSELSGVGGSTLTRAGTESVGKGWLHFADLPADMARQPNLRLPQRVVLSHGRLSGGPLSTLARAIRDMCSPRGLAKRRAAVRARLSYIFGGDMGTSTRAIELLVRRPTGLKRLTTSLADAITRIRLGLHELDLLNRSGDRHAGSASNTARLSLA